MPKSSQAFEKAFDYRGDISDHSQRRGEDSRAISSIAKQESHLRIRWFGSIPADLE